MSLQMETGIHYQDCPICASVISHWRSKQNINNTFNIDKCRKCGYAFVNPRPTLEFIMNYYQNSGLEPGTDSTLHTNITLESIILAEKLDPNPTIDASRMIKTTRKLLVHSGNTRFLDVGCGYGFFSREAKMNGFDITMLELAKNDRTIASEMVGIKPHESTFEDFKAEPEFYSTILMSQILEHALDINEWLSKAHSMLTKKGIIIIALPNFGSIFRKIMQEKEPFITPPTHLNFFNTKSLSTLLKKHGFDVEEVQCVSRLSKKALRRRIPNALKAIAPLIQVTIKSMFALIDKFNSGMIINIYARKT
jgi:SAM-dependent methyltransferase